LSARSQKAEAVIARDDPVVFEARRSLDRLTAGGIILGALIGMAALAGWITPIDPIAQDLTAPFFSPNKFHPMGTDALGRDVLARVLYGTRVSLAVGTLATLLAALLGSLVGLAVGTVGGPADRILMRSVDMMLAFPPLVLLLVAATLFRADGTASLVLLLGLTTWMPVARLVRAEAMSCSRVAHNVAPTIIIAASLQVGDLMLMESGLSFLGLGMAAPTPSWGGMVREGMQSLGDAWWVAAFPGLVLALAVAGFKLIGYGLRGAVARPG
jgi:peptide/nickel transport system permease protein